MYIIFFLHLDPLKRYKCLVAFGGQSPTINCYLCNGLESRNDSYIFGISTHELLVKFSMRALAHGSSCQSARRRSQRCGEHISSTDQDEEEFDGAFFSPKNGVSTCQKSTL